MTLAEVDRALNDLTPGDIGKLAEGDDTYAVAMGVLVAAQKAKSARRALAARQLARWIETAGHVNAREARGWTLYALAGYSAPEQAER